MPENFTCELNQYLGAIRFTVSGVGENEIRPSFLLDCDRVALQPFFGNVLLILYRSRFG